MASTQFDGTELQNSTYIPQFVMHEDAPDRVITSLPLSREDGEILIVELYDKKVIRLQGTLVGSSQADLESKIDTMKEVFSRQEKNLDIDWNGGTRRYVASCSKHTFSRDHYNINAVPWAAEFTVLSGEGKDTSTTNALSGNTLSVATPVADSFSLAGSKPPKPVITITGANWPSGVTGVEYKDTDTGEKIVIIASDGGTFSSTGDVVIDCGAKTVMERLRHSVATPSDFFGVFPKFLVGTNNVQITAGGIVNQSTLDVTVADLTGTYTMQSTTERLAMSFSIPYTTQTFQGITLALRKSLGSPGNITVRIETDNGNKPSGTLADTNATLTISSGSVSGSMAYITSNFASAFGLSANTKYWIVLSAASVDSSNFYDWGALLAGALAGKYARGGAASSSNSGSAYTNTAFDDLSFRLLYGGVPGSGSVVHKVVYTKTYL